MSLSSKSGNRLSNVLFVVALIATAFFGVNLSTVGGIIVVFAWLSYTYVGRHKIEEKVCLEEARSDDWLVCVGKITRVGIRGVY